MQQPLQAGLWYAWKVNVHVPPHISRTYLWPVGDPELAPVEDIAVSAQLSTQPHGAHVGSGASLAHGQSADVLA